MSVKGSTLMTSSFLDALGFSLWVLALFLPIYWWGACYVWQAVRMSKFGALDEGISLEQPKRLSVVKTSMETPMETSEITTKEKEPIPPPGRKAA
jgi:hypothetical protein